MSYRDADRRSDRDEYRRSARERVQEPRVVTEDDVEEAIKYLADNADAAAKAVAEVQYLDNYRSSLKATLMKESKEKTTAAQERDAYAHPNYVAHLAALRIATENAERHKFLLGAKKAIISAWQTQQANNRVLGDFR